MIRLATSVAAILLLSPACGGNGSASPDASPSPTADADPNQPDADPNQPDADPNRPDADTTLPQGTVFDHRHTNLDAIPSACLAHLKDGSFVFHYAHRSHGSQIIVGAESLQQTLPQYAFEASYCSIPSENNVFKMWDGMVSNNLVTADQYWSTSGGLDSLRGILDANSSIRYSMWAWSFEISEQTQGDVQQYLDAMDALEDDYPDVTFIYMTGPAQGEYMAVNRYQRNKQIRDFAVNNGKILYDFEDLEAWYNGDYHTVNVGGVTLPMEHPQYDINSQGNSEYEYTHTTRESCEQKARAFWTMMAVLEGCAP